MALGARVGSARATLTRRLSTDMFRICSLVAAFALGSAIPGASRAAPPAQGSDIDPKAVEALAQTSRYLRGLPAFVVRADVIRDEIVHDDFKLQRTTNVRIAVRGRDRMRADVAGDQGERLLIYDGRALHIYLKTERYYATMTAPATLRETMDAAVDRHGVELPLLDVIYVAMGGDLHPQIRAARAIGPSQVEGTRCEHLAFRGVHVDWQLWIAADGTPVPRKLVITTKDSPTAPQYSAVMRWELSPTLHDDAFAFSPPAGAVPIALGPIAARPEPARPPKGRVPE